MNVLNRKRWYKMKIKLNKVFFFVFVVAINMHADTYKAIGVDGRKYKEFNAEFLTSDVIQNECKDLRGFYLISSKNGKVGLSSSVFSKNIEIKDVNKWVEAEKGEIVSLCLEQGEAGVWNTSLDNRLEKNGCLSVKAPSKIGSYDILFTSLINNVEKNYLIKLAVNQKIIDLSQQKHKLGSRFQYTLKDQNISVILESGVYVVDSIALEKKKVFNDPERLVSSSQKLLVDKYPVTNCEIVQTISDLINTNSAEDEKCYSNCRWGKRKINFQRNPVCTTNDTASIDIYLYQALEYANRRSKMENLVPVYSLTLLHSNASSLANNGVNSDSSFYVIKNTFMTAEAEIFKVDINKGANGYRLPYYDEWIILARGGDVEHKYYWGNSEEPSIVSQYAWYGKFGNISRPVGSLKPNGFGLYDILGLTAEQVIVTPNSHIKRPHCVVYKGGMLRSSLKELEPGFDNEFGSIGQVPGGIRLIRQIN